MKKMIFIFLTIITSAFANQHQDGKYTAQSFSAYKGWTCVVEVTVKDGEVADLYIEDFNKAQAKRSEDIEENEKLKEATKYDYKELVAYFKNEFLAKKDLDEIDTVAGATQIIKKFKGLTKAALRNAEKGDTKRAYD